MFLIIVIASLAPFMMTIIEILDINRLNMFIDDGGRLNAYVHIRTMEDFIIIAMQSAPYFLMKPLPWEADSFLTFIQSFENILILIFLSFSNVFRYSDILCFLFIKFNILLDPL